MKIYALSDIHGFYSIYEQVKNYIQPEDKVIFLGDAADRGPEGWKCIKAILDDPQFIYILGNHDLFLIRRFLGPEPYRNAEMHRWNGGDMTIWNMEDEGDSEEVIKKYLTKLSERHYYISYTNSEGKAIYLSHSGEVAFSEDDINDEEEFTWNRKHFFEDAPPLIDLIVHGHTPIPSLIHKLNDYKVFYTDEEIAEEGDLEFIPGKPFFYAHNTKCDIDCCTILSGSATLLDLDTLEGIPFFVQGDEKECLWRED